MACVDDNLLVEYSHGGLSTDERRAVVQHLDGCETCRRVVASLVGERTAASAEADTTVLAAARTPAVGAPAVGSVLADRFRLTRVLGEGGMGVVYAAEDLELGIPVALKLMSPGLAEDSGFERMLENEVVSARRVTHRNVCRVYDVGASGRLRFLTMELIEGRSLDRVLEQGRLPPAEAARVFSEIAAGLAAAHDHGITHRDLKPGNVMLDERGTAKLMDFGIASETHRAHGEETPVGTPRYMAPEQAFGAPPRPPADVYSAGVIGFRLFSGRSSAEAFDQSARALIPARFRSVIDRCLQAESEARFPDGAALHRAVERARRLPRRWATAAALLLVVALGLGAAVRASRAPSAAERLRSALREVERGRVEPAAALLQSVFKDEPRNPDALFYAALVAWWRASILAPQTAGAVQAALAVPQSPARQLLLRALVPLSEHRWGDALVVLAARPAGDADEPWLAYARSEALYHSGRPREAMAMYLDILRQRPDFRLAYEHLVDYGLATFDAPALAALKSNGWLEGDPYFSPYAAVVKQWRAGPAAALPLTERRQPDELDQGHSPALRSLRLKLLLLLGRRQEAVEVLGAGRAVTGLTTLDDVGLQLAVGHAAAADEARGSLERQLSRGALADVEFRMRSDLWVLGRFRQPREALARDAAVALALPVLDRDRLINHRMLRALALPDEDLPALAGDEAPVVAAVVRARVAERDARWAEAAQAWNDALLQSLDDRWSHLLRVFVARAWAQANERDRARQACEVELAAVSLRYWSLFPARAECALLTAELLLADARPGEAGELLAALRRTRADDADDDVQRALDALEERRGRP